MLVIPFIYGMLNVATSITYYTKVYPYLRVNNSSLRDSSLLHAVTLMTWVGINYNSKRCD